MKIGVAVLNEQGLWYQVEGQCKLHSRIVKACDGKYDRFGTLVNVIDLHSVMLERVSKDEIDWSDAENIFCLELLTSSSIGMTSCGHMFPCLSWSNHFQVLCMDQNQALYSMCRTNITAFCHCTWPDCQPQVNTRC